MVEQIVRHLCGNEANGDLGSEEAIKSLIIKMYDKSIVANSWRQAFHKATSHSDEIDEVVVRKVESLRTVLTD